MYLIAYMQNKKLPIDTKYNIVKKVLLQKGWRIWKN